MKNLAVMLLACFFLSIGTTRLCGQTEAKIDPDLQEAFPDLPTRIDPVAASLQYRPVKGQQWTYRVVTDTDIDTMGMVMPKKDRQLINIEIGEVDDTGFKFTSSMAEMFSEMRTRGGSIVVDSVNPDNEMADPAFQPLMKLWKVVRKSTLTGKVALNGEITDYKIPKEVRDAIDSEGKPYGISASDLMGGFVVGLSSLPQGTVSVGQTWEMQTVFVPMQIPNVTQTAIYLGVVEVDGAELAMIQSEFKAEVEDGDGMMSDADITAKSIILFDIKAGNIWKAYTVTEGEMVLNMGGNEIIQVTTGTGISTRVDEK